MNVLRSVCRSTTGAMMLARGQSSGVLLIGTEPGAIAHSFLAMALSLVLSLYFFALQPQAEPTLVSAEIALLRHATLFVVAWLSFMVVSHAIATRLYRRGLWRQMIVVWAWCQVPMNLLAMLGAMPAADGAPGISCIIAAVLTLGWGLWVEWFGFRLTFSPTRMGAVLMVLADQMIGILLTVADRLVSGG